MLTELMVENVGVIERAELVLESGCSALTGETGAGKTLLVAAVGLLLGARADRTLIRAGAAEARVEGRFVVPAGHPAVALLTEAGVVDADDTDDDIEIVVARTLGGDGRPGKVRISGRLVTVAVLGEAVGRLVEIAGQHEHHHLATPVHQRRVLDGWAGPDVAETADQVAAAVRLVAELRRAAEEASQTERERTRAVDTVRFEIGEIEAARLIVGESERLEKEAARLTHAEAIATALDRAAERVRGERGAADLVAEARREVDAAAARDPDLAPLAERLETASYEIADVAEELARRIVAPDPDVLEKTNERLAVITKLKRKYGRDEREILDYLERARAKLCELERSEESAGRVTEELARRQARAEELAARLSDARRVAAGSLEAAVQDLLADLALPDARFSVQLEPRSLYEGGAEAVQFLVALNGGEAVRPLGKVASGGELARIALALHLLVAADSTSTMIFDEVDAGVGGRAAQAVGRALSRLATTTGAQVMLVTHLPQVAAFGDNHYRVSKQTSGSRVSARVERVEGEERIAELSRMLAGLPESERAQEHAQELLDLAGAK